MAGNQRNAGPEAETTEIVTDQSIQDSPARPWLDSVRRQSWDPAGLWAIPRASDL
jgi:hypothetical protein